MASLEIVLGVAAAIVLLGVLAVRVSVRSGALMLLYLGIGCCSASRCSAFSSPTRSHRVDRHRCAGDDLIEVASPPVGNRAARLAWASRCPLWPCREHRRGRVGVAPAARAGVANRVPLGCRALLHRRGGRVSACCAGRGLAADLPDARARVGHERCAGRAGRAAARLRRSVHLADPAAGGLRAGRGRSASACCSGSVGRGRCAGPHCPRRSVPTGRHRSLCARLPTSQSRNASGLLATYVAALVLGNSNLPHRGGVRSLRRGMGWLAQIGLFRC